jgi:hypothetical protein
MNFIHSNLGNIHTGDILEVTLTKGANVRLLDSLNFNNYKNGRACKFIGGLAKVSPLKLQVPRSGQWHAVVDMNGLSGSTSASFRIL